MISTILPVVSLFAATSLGLPAPNVTTYVVDTVEFHAEVTPPPTAACSLDYRPVYSEDGDELTIMAEGTISNINGWVSEENNATLIAELEKCGVTSTLPVYRTLVGTDYKVYWGVSMRLPLDDLTPGCIPYAIATAGGPKLDDCPLNEPPPGLVKHPEILTWPDKAYQSQPPTANCTYRDRAIYFFFKIEDLNWWAEKDDADRLWHELSGCGLMSMQCEYRSAKNVDEAGRLDMISFALPIFIKGGCVERAIATAGGPKLQCERLTKAGFTIVDIGPKQSDVDPPDKA